MASRGTRYRLPRKVKKARHKLYASGFASLTPKQRTWLMRCLVFASLGGWNHIRHRNAHVAMGDTTTARLRERRDRVRAQYHKRERRRFGG